MKSATRKRITRLMALCLVLLACIVLSATSFADPKTAKKFAREGAKAYGDGDYDTALAKFSQAYEADANPALLYNMGRVYENKAEFSEAIAQYTRFVTSPDVDQDARADAMERIKTLGEVLELTGAQKPAAKAPASSKTAKPSAPKLAAGQCVDLNKADVKELTKLTGVGESTARKIADLRDKKGGFKSPDEIMEVSGIAQGKYAKMKDGICPFGAPSAQTPKPAAAAAQTPKAPAAPQAAAAAAQAPKAPAAAPAPAKKDLPVLEI